MCTNWEQCAHTHSVKRVQTQLQEVRCHPQVCLLVNMIINTGGSTDKWQAYLHFTSVDTGHLSTVVSEVTLSREVEDSSEQQTVQQRRSDTGLTCSSISNSTVLLGKRTGNVWPESLNWVATIANVIVIVDQTQPTIRPPTLGCVTCGTQLSDKCSDSNFWMLSSGFNNEIIDTDEREKVHWCNKFWCLVDEVWKFQIP